MRTTWFTRCFRGEAQETGSPAIEARQVPADTEAVITKTVVFHVPEKTVAPAAPVADEEHVVVAEEPSEAPDASDDQTEIEEEPVEQESSLDVSHNNATIGDLELLRRQDPACQVIPFCDLCARVFETPCLQFGIITESRISSVRVDVDIWENGGAVCGLTAECGRGDTSPCDGGTVDCMNGHRAEYFQNRITYWNDDLGFGPINIYLDQVVDDEIILCCEHCPLLLLIFLQSSPELLTYFQRNSSARSMSIGASSGAITGPRSRRRAQGCRGRTCSRQDRTERTLSSIVHSNMLQMLRVARSDG